jgi:hypothetical protein
MIEGRKEMRDGEKERRTEGGKEERRSARGMKRGRLSVSLVSF